MPVYDAATLGLKIDSKEFNKEMGSTGTRTEKVLGSMSLQAKAFDDRWSEITKGIKDTKRIIGGILISRGFYAVLQGVTGASSALLEFSKNMEKAKISLEYFADAAAGTNLAMNKVTAYLNTVNAFAAKTPFTTEQVLSMSKYMQAVGVSMNATQSFLKVITDAAAATGATEENLQRVVFGLGQMLTKGRLANEEIRQLANANIPIYEILQEELGLTGKQISNIGTQWVRADKAVVAILNGLSKRYDGAADRIADTMSGMFDTIIDDSKIVASEAFAGVYRSLGNVTTNIRDKLDEMREVVTEEGAGGLFNKILLDLDPSGAVGTAVLNFIGNVYNLGSALHGLYLSAQPVLQIMGSAFTGTVNFAVISLTGMVSALDEVVRFLNLTGLTTGSTAQVIATLVVAYKAAHWLSFMGEAAVKAAYGLYQTAMAAAEMLPASIRARTGLSLLAVGLSSVIALALTAAGVFSALNGAFSGMGNSDMFSGEYNDKLTKYNEDMKAYYAEIEKYQKDYEQDYSTIENAAGNVTDETEAAAKATKAGANAANDWLAAFDEVYSIPDPSGGGGSGSTMPTPPDFGALLSDMQFKFPTIDIAAITKPTLDLAEMFRDGILNNDVMDAGWWTSLLPALFLGGAASLSKILAGKRKAAADAAGTGGGTGGTPSPFQTTREALAALKDLTKKFGLQEKSVKELIEQIKKGDFATETEQRAAYDKLRLQLEPSEKLLEKINNQLIIAGKFGTVVASDILKEAKNMSEMQLIAENVTKLKELAEAAKETGFNGDAARNELAQIKKLLEKQYANYIGRNGASTPELDMLLKGVINTKGLDEKILKLVDSTADIKKQLEEANYKTLDLGRKIEETNKLGNGILNELEAIGADTAAIKEPLQVINDIYRLQQLQTKLSESLTKLDSLNELVKNAEAAGISPGKGLEIVEEISSVKSSIQHIERKIDVQIELLKIGTAEQRAALTAQQKLLEANRAFTSVVEGVLKRNLTAITKPLRAIETYTNKLIVEQAEGQKLLSLGIRSVTDTIGKLPVATHDLFKPVLEQLGNAYKDVVATGKVPRGFTANTTADLIKGLGEVGKAIGASSDVITTTLDNVYSAIQSINGHTNELDYAVKQLAADKKQSKTGTESSTQFLDKLSEKLEVIEDTAKSLKDFDKGITALRKEFSETFPAEYSFYIKRITDAVVTSREFVGEKLEKLANLQKLAESTLYKEGLNSPAVALLKDMKQSLDVIKDWQIGAGIRRGAAWPNETPGTFGNAINAGYIHADIIEAGLFSPYKVPLSAGDMAGTITGQSGYGNNVWTIMADNLSDMGKAIAGVPANLKTIRSIANLMLGKVGEVPALVAAAKKFAEKGITIANGDIFLDETRKLQAQLDAIAFNTKGRLIAPLDAKVLASFANKFKPILDKLAVLTDGIYRINTKGFTALINASDDIAWQLATQAKILGTTKAYLAVLDSKGAGIPNLNISGLSQYNPTIESHVKKIERLLAKQASEQIAKRLDKIADNIYLVEVAIPKWAKDVVAEQGKMFAELQRTVSKDYLLSNSIDKLVTPINMLGEKIGNLTLERFGGATSLPSGSGDAALNSILRDINTQLNSSNALLFEMGKTNLQEVLERIEAAIYDGSSSIVPRVIDLGFTATGTKAVAQLTGDRLLLIVDQIKAFQASFENRATALTIQLGDLMKQMNSAANENLKLLDKLASGKTVSDLAWSIMDTDKKLTGGSDISKQMQSILSAGGAMPVTNTAGFADLGTLLTKIAAGQSGKTAEQGLTPASANMFIPAYMFNALSSTIDLNEIFENLFATMSVEGQLATEKAMADFNAKYGGMPDMSSPGSITSNIFGTHYDMSTDALGSFPEEYQKAVIGPLQQLLDIKNANISPFASDLLLGGLFKSIADKFVEDMPAEKQATTVDGQYLKDSQLLYKYGIASVAERAVRQAMDSLDPSKYAPVTAQTAMSYKSNSFAMPWTNAGEYNDWIIQFLKENKTATEKINALNTIASDRYSKEYEYLTYLMQYADSSLDKAKQQLLKPFVEQSDLYEQLGLEKLDELGPIVAEIQKYVKDMPDLTYQNLESYAAIIQQIVDQTQATLLPILEAQGDYNAGSIPGNGDYSRVIAADVSSLSESAAKQLSDVLGITFTSVSEGLSAINIDAENIKNNIIGWTAEMPDAINITSADISTADAQILANAGIQINANGSVTFMKPINANQSGTERTIDLTLADVAPAVTQKLQEAGLSVDFGNAEGTALNLSIDTLSANMTGALFKLSDDLTGEVSESMRTALAGLGEITASGYFRITHPEVLSGALTITDYLKSLGEDIKAVSPEVEEALKAIDNVYSKSTGGLDEYPPKLEATYKKIDSVMQTYGKTTASTIATWADGIIIKSPIDAEELTDEMILAFQQIGVSFTQENDEFMMVINKAGQQLKDGITIIPKEVWSSLSMDIRTALKAMGVTTAETAAGIMLDVSNVMSLGAADIVSVFVNTPELWDQIPQTLADALAAAGVSVVNGMIQINTDMLDGLVSVDNQWYGKWSTLPEDVIASLGASKLATADGLLRIEQITADTVIPDNVDEYIKKPFSELPDELKDNLTGGNASVLKALKDAEVLITPATKDAFVGAIQAVRSSFGAMTNEAASGAADIASAVARAMESIRKLSSIPVGKSGFLGLGAKNQLGNDIQFKGVTYKPEIDSSGKTIKYWYVDSKTGAYVSVKSIPGYAYGGIIGEEGYYKAGEFGKHEAIIPLENRQSLRMIGSTIASYVGVKALAGAAGMQNAGIATSSGRGYNSSVQTADAMAKSVLERMLPAIMNTSDSRPILYVDTLIADDAGLRLLEKKMSTIRQTEDRRKR